MSEYNLPKVGDVITGEIIKIEKDLIYIDFQAVSEGLIYLNEYDSPAPKSFSSILKVGDSVTAEIKKISEQDDSVLILLSRLPIVREEQLKELDTLNKTKEVFTGKVIKALEKGLIVKYKLFELFLPFSLLDREYTKEPEKLIGEDLDVVMEDFGQGRGRRLRLIVSRMPIIQELRREKFEKQQKLRDEELEKLQTGVVVEGTVEKIEKHAAHIRFEHVMGLLRISQVAHYRIDNLEDELTVGEKVKVKIIKREGNRIDLSKKVLLPTPFEAFMEKYKKGDTAKGKIVQKLGFGVIVEIEKDIKGLLHNQEYSWNPRDNFENYLKIDDEIEVFILNIDPKRERIALSKRMLDNNPWKDVNLKVGQVLEVLVTEVAEDRLTVSYDSIDGVIYAKEAAVERISLDNNFSIGDKVEAIVTKFNQKQWLLELSIRRLLVREERKGFEKFLSDDEETTTATIGDLLDFGNDK